MASPDDIDTELRHLTDDVIYASKLPPRQRGTPIRTTIDTLAGLAYSHGLTTPHLTTLIDLITQPSHLDQASLATLAKNLYPATTVPAELVVRAVAALGHGELKVGFAIQAVLVKWLIMVQHVVDKPEVLGRVYSVLFNLLDTGAIRAVVCHLLALVTRRRHVRPFRIQYLMDLSLRQGSDPAIIGLLRVYKDYYPEIIVGEAIKGRASAFKHPDPAWRARLDEIQEEHLRNNQPTDLTQPHSGFRSRRVLGVRAKSLVPGTHTSHATEQSITLEEIDSATHFVNSLEKITLPDQLIAVVSDPLLQKLLLLRPAAATLGRITAWISSLARDIADDPSDVSILADMLSVLSDYISATKHFPPAVLSFFQQFIPTWNGHDCQEVILHILSFLPLNSWTTLYSSVIQPLESRLLSTAVHHHGAQRTMLMFYTSLLRHWSSLFLANDPQAESATSITTLISHGNLLTATLAQGAPPGSGIASYLVILDFFEQSAACCAIPGLKENIRIMLPDSALIYGLMFSQSPAVLARLCAVLCVYKKALEQVVLLRRGGDKLVDSSSYHKSYVDLFNGYLMDLVNCIWRLRAFSRGDPNAQGCLLPQELVTSLDEYIKSLDSSLGVAMTFGLSLSPSLSSISIAAFREIEHGRMQEDRDAVVRRHAGPVTAQSLAKLASQGGIEMGFQEYRVKVLKYMDQRGLFGIPELMRNTMKILMTPRKPGPGMGGASQESGSGISQSQSTAMSMSQ